MSNARFKKGDKVRILDGSKIKDYTFDWWADGMSRYVGQTATIKNVIRHSSGRTAYTVEEFSFKWDERGLKPTESDTVVIYRKGQEVIAYDKVTGKKATAKCAPDDKFNFETGAKLAFERLFGHMPDERRFKVGDRVIGNDKAKRYAITGKGWKGRVINVCENSDMIVVDGPHGDFTVRADCFDLDTSPEFFTGKAVCIDSNCSWFTKGKIYKFKDGTGYDDDGDTITVNPISSIEELNTRIKSQFVEVVE